jgi:hypothetical protein
MDNLEIRTDYGTTRITIGSLPNKCPYCHFTIHPTVQGASLRHLSFPDQMDVTLKCTNNACQHLFVTEFKRTYETGSSYDCYDFLKISTPDTYIKTEFSDSIYLLSFEFVIIYNQAEHAEEAKLDRIAGVGYRKALEFLVKDYLINNEPDNDDLIKKTMLGPCIQKIDDKRIKDIAERATWLGNDETHYVRKWVGKDINDLKALIKLVVHYIDAELLYQDTIGSMPK